MKHLVRKIAWLALALLFALAFATALRAQTADSTTASSQSDDDEDTPDCKSPDLAYFWIVVGRGGYSSLELTFCYQPSREAELRRELPAALGCPPSEIDYKTFSHNGLGGFDIFCTVSLEHSATEINGSFNLKPLQDLLKSARVDSLQAMVIMPHNVPSRCAVDSARENSATHVVACSWQLKNDARDPSVLLFSTGFARAQATRIIGILALLLALPLVAALWFRGRARDAQPDGIPELLFSYRRFIRWTGMFGALVWWSAIDLTHADELVRYVLPRVRSSNEVFGQFFPWILLWLPAVAVYFACTLLSAPLHNLRGTNRSFEQAFRQSFWGIARFVIPVLFVMLGVTELYYSPRLGALFLAAWILSARYLGQKFADSWGLDLRAISSGELRDRAFALAKKARTRLNQLYLMPAEQMRMANAFAHAASNIYLTDYLLKNLNKSEVDAIIGHEMAHLQKKHVQARIIGFVVAAGAVGFASGWLQDQVPSNFPVGPLGYALLLVVMLFTSRRNEFSADKGAVALTGDAEAMITGLARVTRLNTMPIHWNQLDEKLLTHPSTLRRIRNLARIGNIPESRIPILLEEAAKPAVNTYDIAPSTALGGKVFSTRWKSRFAWRHSWILILVTTTIPCLTVLVTQRLALSASGARLALLAGLLLTLGSYLAISDFSLLIPYRKLESRLREKLAKYGSAAATGAFVGLIPHSVSRIYEGNWSWDIGLLRLTRERMIYVGEEARFGIRREEIVRLSQGPKSVGWIPATSVSVEWRDASGTIHSFSVRALESASLLGMRRQTRQLTTDLDSWLRGLPPSPGALLSVESSAAADSESPEHPAFGEVTSASPKVLVNGNFLSRFFFSDTFVAVLVAVLFGVPLPVLNDLAPLSAPLTFLSSGGAAMYILGTVWLARIFQLIPYWRFREPKREGTVPQGTPAGAASA